MTPLLLQKVLIAATFVPAFGLLKLHRNVKKSPGVIPSVGSTAPSAQFSQLVTWGELTIIWGPLVPAIYPALLLALALNCITYEIKRRHFGVDVRNEPGTCGRGDEPPSLSKLFLKMSVAIGWGFSVWFAHDAGMFAFWLLCALPFVALGWLCVSAREILQHNPPLVRSEELHGLELAPLS